MTVKLTEIVMRIPLPEGGYALVAFDHIRAPDFAPSNYLNGARMAHQSAPLCEKSLKENGAGAPLLHSAPGPSQEWRNTSPSGRFRSTPKTPKTVQEELNEARDALASKSSEMAVLDAELAPARAEESQVRDGILATHGRSADGVVIYDLAGRRERKALFCELDRIASQWGGKKAERKNLNSQIRTLEKQIQHLERIVSKESQKRTKHGQAS